MVPQKMPPVYLSPAEKGHLNQNLPVTQACEELRVEQLFVSAVMELAPRDPTKYQYSEKNVEMQQEKGEK
jgi:hypothetical protein